MTWQIQVLLLQLRLFYHRQNFLLNSCVSLVTTPLISHTQQTTFHVFHEAAMKKGRTSVIWIVQVPFVSCPRILRSLGHKEASVVCGGFMAGRERGSDFTLCWAETRRVPIQLPHRALKSHLYTYRLRTKLNHRVILVNLLMLGAQLNCIFTKAPQQWGVL